MGTFFMQKHLPPGRAFDVLTGCPVPTAATLCADSHVSTEDPLLQCLQDPSQAGTGRLTLPPLGHKAPPSWAIGRTHRRPCLSSGM